MASFEQLQMMNDDETTSSSSSNRSDDEEDIKFKNSSSSGSTNDVVQNNGLAGQGDGRGCKKANSERLDTATGDSSGHHKKRIKLSIGGAFKSIISSSENEIQEQQSKLKNADSAATDMDLKSNTKRPEHSFSPTNPRVNTSTTKNESFRISNSQSESVNASGDEDSSRITTKLQQTSEGKEGNSKAKSTATTATSSVTKKIKEIKRRQLHKSSPQSSTVAGENHSTCTKKRSSIRSIRITPMSSPGLLLPLGTNVRGGGITNTTNILSTSSSPNSAFAQTMANAGYTTESRTETPHRGSSVERIVDDMFDSNIKFCLRFPKIVPDKFILNPNVSPTTVTSSATGVDQKLSTGCSSRATVENAEMKPLKSTKAVTIKLESTENNAMEGTKSNTFPILIQRLLKAFPTNHKDKISSSKLSSKDSSNHETESLFSTNTDSPSRKRLSRIPQYTDIVPISLSFTYPNEYIKKRLEYVMKVDKREKAIVALQEKQHANQGASDAMSTEIAPIPTAPDIFMRADLSAITHDENRFGSNDQQQQSHPLYLPKNQVLVDHLDKRCFHMLHGRYFGLSSNPIVDPYFSGPNAPCIGGLNLSASTGLATASSGGGAGSLGVPLFATPAQLLSTSASNSKIAASSTTTSV